MSDDFTNALRDRLSSLNVRRDLLRGSLERLQSEVNKVERQIDLYRTALVLEGVEADSQHKAELRPETESLASNADTLDGSKISKIRRFIAHDRSEGFEARDIAKYVKASGISPHGAFAYNVIKRLKDNGELISDGNEYFPTGKLLEALGQSKISFNGVDQESAKD